MRHIVSWQLTIFVVYYSMIKNGKKQNVIPTTRKQNMGAAKTCETYNEAISLVRALQHANDMGTHGGDFSELETFFIEKQGLMDYVENGFKKD